MIIACPCGEKKFNVDTSLIPQAGRMLQCGFCDRKWHYKHLDNVKPPEKQYNYNDEEIFDKDKSIDQVIEKSEDKISANKKETKNIKNNKIVKKSGILNILIVILISFAAIILVLETFKSQISTLIPDIDFYLSSLYESTKDIYLFFKDLLK